MTLSRIIIFFFGLFWAAIFPEIRSQLSEEEVPPQLRFLLHSDLDKWEPPKEFTQMFPYYLSGFDSENRPIWVFEAGKWDVRAVVERGPEWEQLFDMYSNKALWELWNSTYIKGTPEYPVKDGILIVDFNGLDRNQLHSPAAVGYLFKKLRVVVAALPFAHGVYVVNANFIAKNVINLSRPIIGKDFHRVDVFGTNPSTYKPFLLKNLPKDQIAEWYGGDKDFKPVKVYG